MPLPDNLEFVVKSLIPGGVEWLTQNLYCLTLWRGEVRQGKSTKRQHRLIFYLWGSYLVQDLKKTGTVLQFYKGLSINYEIQNGGIADIVTTATTGCAPLLLDVQFREGFLMFIVMASAGRVFQYRVGSGQVVAGVTKKHQKFIFECWVFSQKSYLNVWCFEKVHIWIPKIPYLHTYNSKLNFSTPASVKARSSLVYNVFHQIGKIRTSGILGKGYEFWQWLWAKLILE